ncbi:hypothetical protein Y1Q_0015913 [Alligator mississippiensis]|uniref:Uncharacterized protein n=1 Tax=Alligator mississippiensis TaxID=8496 RepID=A0A151MHH0_ALLMI|nr:hypothetical protein Y1Q_0015913 [Alligator mississippiensis]
MQMMDSGVRRREWMSTHGSKSPVVDTYVLQASLTWCPRQKTDCKVLPNVSLNIQKPQEELKSTEQLQMLPQPEEGCLYPKACKEEFFPAALGGLIKDIGFTLRTLFASCRGDREERNSNSVFCAALMVSYMLIVSPVICLPRSLNSMEPRTKLWSTCC